MSEQVITQAGDAAKQIVAQAVGATDASATSVAEHANAAIDHVVAQGKAVYQAADAARVEAKNSEVAAIGRFHEFMKDHGRQLLFGVFGALIFAALLAWAFHAMGV
jgi:hypothetical protein